ncbi:MAG TPA: helix-turn-helix transcriptional regulator [Streptosporangiaceae bacterium]|nr:helix-turn-helix transcriptional regulator [Streptosporangiaceae bacterium]
MPSSSSSAAHRARQALADQLREMRLAAGLSGSALASRAGWHGVSKVSKIEHGVRPASGDDVRTWCEVCGATAERTEELLAEQRAVAGMWVPYQQLNRAGLRKAQESVRPSYDNSALVRSYQPKIVPGLLQTAAYTTALLEDARDRQRVQRDDVAEAVAERVSRQKVLTRAGHRFVFVIEEPVLRYRFCEPEILRGQLLHLRDASRLPAVWLGIIPLGGDRRRVLPREGFIVFDEELVSVELISGVLSVSQPREVGMYLRDFADLARIAVHGQAARDLIAEALRDLP